MNYVLSLLSSLQKKKDKKNLAKKIKRNSFIFYWVVESDGLLNAGGIVLRTYRHWWLGDSAIQRLGSS